MSRTWLDTLNALPTDGLATLGADDIEASRSDVVPIACELTHLRSGPHSFEDLTKVANAADALASLPKRGESLHMVMAGNFDAFDFVPAVLRLAAPATVAALYVATLGFNRQNTQTLCRLLDAGQVASVTMLVSVYFRSMSDGQPIYEELHEALTSRGHRLAARRSHAKILAFELSDGRALTMEMSANLRSCRNIEQATLTHDEGLLEFHRGWIEDVIRTATDR